MLSYIKIMTDLILYILNKAIEIIESSAMVGPDGTIYELVLLVLYVMFQMAGVSGDKFLERLPKRSTMGIVLMVLLFFPGIIVKLLCINVAKIIYKIGKILNDFFTETQLSFQYYMRTKKKQKRNILRRLTIK